VLTVGERTNANGSKAFREEQSTDAFVLHHPEADPLAASVRVCTPTRR
jgi:cobalamin-dependent methionine synthase I